MVENIENGTSGMVIRRGPNYVVYETDEQEVKKAWLYDLVESTKEESNAYNQTDQPNEQISQSSNFTPVHNGESHELDRLLRELDEDTKAERSETQTERYENADEFIEELELEMEQLLTRRQDLVDIAKRDELIYQSTEVNKTDDT